MNRGQRYIRNTVLAMMGVTLLVTGASRLYASVVEPGTPPWLRSLMSLGLKVELSRNDLIDVPKLQAVRLEDAGQLQFNQVYVDGNFAVEVVAAPLHRVSLSAGTGRTEGVEVKGQKGGTLLIHGDRNTEGAVLHIEAPALIGINAQWVSLLRVRGFQARQFSVTTKNAPQVRLEENALGVLYLRAETPVELQVDKSTISAGLNIQSSGSITLLGEGGQKVHIQGTRGEMNFRTADGEISIHPGK